LGDGRFLRVRGEMSVFQQMRIDDVVNKLVQRNGSDLHLKVGAPPEVRVRGLLY
jgi:Tfp pilus assembly ATPase PilU